MNKEFKVILAPTVELAKPYDGVIDATVEAEYGNHVIHGNVITLAHHTTEYLHCPAPINSNPNVVVENILVSHLDLDTIGGIMNITGNSIYDEGFKEAAEYVDVHGPHYLYKFPEQKAKIEAYWAWNASQPRSINHNEVVDVTEQVIKSMEAIQRILYGDSELIGAGEKWAQESSLKVESCLVSETEFVRIFATDDVFCNGAYYKSGAIIPFIVSFNTKFGNISVSCANPKEFKFNAKDFVQALWGNDAGGHAGIAGSPRGKRMTLTDLFNAVQALENYILKSNIEIK